MHQLFDALRKFAIRMSWAKISAWMNLSKDMVQNRSSWRQKIKVKEVRQDIEAL